MTGRALHAWIDGTAVGTVEEAAGIWRFRYRPEWLQAAHAYPLCPSLPLQAEPIEDGGSQRPVQWYFDNLLPEEGQRRLLAADAGIEIADAFGLLGYYGAESAGSLTLLPPEALPRGPGGLGELPDAALSARIKGLPSVPLAHGAMKRMSLAGAQHKLAVVEAGGELFEPSGAEPSTHILKPDHPDPDYPHSVANEWFVMTLAGRVGLEVPAVQRRYVPEPVYLVQRFDRVPGAPVRRRHAIDACQLLGLDRGFKYSQGSMENLARLAAACRNRAQARVRLYNWLVFNVLTGNGDAHLKNLSFLVDAGGVQLAPHYDLVSVACYDAALFDKQRWPDQTELAWPILGVRHFSNLGRSLLVEAGVALGIRAAQATRLLDTQRQRVVVQALQLLGDVEAANEQLLLQRPELAPTLAGEGRCLRGIVHVVIREMAARLGGTG